MRPHFDTYVQGFGLSDRLQFFPCDFFTDPLPAADVFAMGRVLHDWDLATKRQLIAKVFDALPPGRLPRQSRLPNISTTPTYHPTLSHDRSL